eukprot:SAG31_NODE_2560_length_5482_cov_7.141373_4_plen_744_part_01
MWPPWLFWLRETIYYFVVQELAALQNRGRQFESEQALAAHDLHTFELQQESPISPALPERLVISSSRGVRGVAKEWHSLILGHFRRCTAQQFTNGKITFERDQDARVMLWWAAGYWIIGLRDDLGAADRAILRVQCDADDPSRANRPWCVQQTNRERRQIKCSRAELWEAAENLRSELDAELRSLYSWRVLALTRSSDDDRIKLARVKDKLCEIAAADAALGTLSAAERSSVLAKLRNLLRVAQSIVSASQHAIVAVQPAQQATSRAGYLQSLRQLMGPRPAAVCWEQDWAALRLTKIGLKIPPERATTELREQLQQNLEQTKSDNRADIEQLVAAGWPRSDAEVTICALEVFPNQLARSLRDRDPRFVATQFALADAISAAAVRQHVGGTSVIAPRLYANLHAVVGTSLCGGDPQWGSLTEPDHTGFCGLSSTVAIAEAHCDARCFGPEGYRKRVTSEEGLKFVPVDGEVVCFESKPADENGFHSAVMLTETRGTFPPLTLFRLREIKEPGEWEAPGGLHPAQRLLVCTATYRPPLPASDANGSIDGKLCIAGNTLRYGDKTKYIAGLDDLLLMPALTMAEEWDRDLEWQDWKAQRHTSQVVWSYVTHQAIADVKTRRDLKNQGKTPTQFCRDVNKFIQTRREAGCGDFLPEANAFLTVDEVIAVRLYSGPAYQPINDFLRQISSLTGKVRKYMAMNPELTFAATVGHICRAIRKLSAVSIAEDTSAPLWRGVRGELPRSFWA